MTEKLSERVEAHNGGDSWPLRVDIAEALGWTSKPVGGVIAWYAPEEPDVMKAGPPKWLTSLDAAMSLVPEGCALQVQQRRSHEYFYVYFRSAEQHEGWSAKNDRLAIALCAAALKSRGL